jgi:hypothetical protein
MREVLERKNRDLDALHFVWCDGGCESGVQRYVGDKLEITEELIEKGEANLFRLRTWLTNYKFRNLSDHKKSAYFKSFKYWLRRKLYKWYWSLKIK